MRSWLLIGSILSAAAQPAAETPAPADAPPAAATPAPPIASPPTPAVLPPPPPSVTFVPLDQPVYGGIIAVLPAHRIAMAEAGQSLYADDPLVGLAAERLAGLTAGYLEDASRIAELTLRATQAIRASNQPASPFAIMNGALRWKRPRAPSANIPRIYEGFINRYARSRIQGKAGHDQALSAMQPPPPRGR